jgi:hypothetical protein
MEFYINAITKLIGEKGAKLLREKLVCSGNPLQIVKSIKKWEANSISSNLSTVSAIP